LFGEFFVFLRINIEPLTFESFAIKLSNEKDEPHPAKVKFVLFFLIYHQMQIV
jgi:hypothetical protein